MLITKPVADGYHIIGKTSSRCKNLLSEILSQLYSFPLSHLLN